MWERGKMAGTCCACGAVFEGTTCEIPPAPPPSPAFPPPHPNPPPPPRWYVWQDLPLIEASVRSEACAQDRVHITHSLRPAARRRRLCRSLALAAPRFLDPLSFPDGIGLIHLEHLECSQ